MLPSAGWGAVRHRPRQKIGAKLNQSILEMALVSQCQGERLQERDQAGAGRRGPGGRHRCRGTAGCLLTPTCVGYGGSSCCQGGQSRMGSSRKSRAWSRLHASVSPHSVPLYLVKEGSSPSGKTPGGLETPPVPTCIPTLCPGQSVPSWEGRFRTRETKTPALDTNIDGSSEYGPCSLAN